MITRCDNNTATTQDSGVSDNLRNIFRSFKLTDAEFEMLRKKFGDLCKYEAWQLLRKNLKNNHTDELEDIEQDLLLAMAKAGIYYKRQTYIEECIRQAKKHVKDPFLSKMVVSLSNLWDRRKFHGASRQTFGQKQERVLNQIISTLPFDQRPNPKKPLVMCDELIIYCKGITWNQQRALGRKISKERSIRTGCVSLSEYNFLSQDKKLMSY
jgi:hypothetical protein